jgi:hypothetical protein
VCRKSIGSGRFFSSVIVLRISMVAGKKKLICRFFLSLSQRDADDASVAAEKKFRRVIVFFLDES